jgi:hypothetical protein
MERRYLGEKMERNMNNESNVLIVIDEEKKIIREYFREMGRRGGEACRGRESARIRAVKAGRASGVARRSKREAAAVDTE